MTRLPPRSTRTVTLFPYTTPFRAVGINVFGRIGRTFFRAAKGQGADIDFVAVNYLGSLETMAHLLQYDSVMGRFPETVGVGSDGITIGDDTLKVLAERNPADLPWGDLGVDVVIESTGFFTDRDKAAAHLDAGAPLVIVSARSEERRLGKECVRTCGFRWSRCH